MCAQLEGGAVAITSDCAVQVLDRLPLERHQLALVLHASRFGLGVGRAREEASPPSSGCDRSRPAAGSWQHRYMLGCMRVRRTLPVQGPGCSNAPLSSSAQAGRCALAIGGTSEVTALTACLHLTWCGSVRRLVACNVRREWAEGGRQRCSGLDLICSGI